ncbi:hypothetical protein U9M48_003370 [Paspalum notatum var. saurae]|uniref:GAG-pre-integrase domain-containing protein n=1 Tax=Paspalum notatum var. saurae TaxID=547442 RepID=A0AAQ3PSL8_PASNO
MYYDMKERFWWYGMKRVVADYQASLKKSPFEALYGKRCRTPLFWNQTGEKQLKKCLRVPKEQAPLEGLEVQEDLTYTEHPVKILDTSERYTRNKRIKMCRVQWSHHKEAEATWEREDELKADRGMEDVWIMDFGCSRHMTGHRKWFSSLNPVSTRSTSHSGIMVKVFRVDLTSVSGPARCLVASPSADIWKWHRRLGHLSFDLLVRLSSMGLIRGLPKLRAEKDLVCHPCRHGKMVAASHTPVSQVMTSYLERVVERKNSTLVEMARTMLDEHRTPRHFWTEAVSTACYIANRFFLRAFLRKTLYELRFGRQPSVKHLQAFGCRCFVLKKAGHLDKFEYEIFLGYASSSRAFRVWILEAKQVVETCEVSFDETMPCTTPAFELLGDDEEGTPIFEDEEGAYDVGDAGATAPAPAPTSSAMSSDDDGRPLPTASSLLPR